MTHNNAILQELENLGPSLIPLQKIQVYSVPEGFFAGSSEQVLTRVRMENSQILPSPVDVMSVPEGYFQHFADSVLKKIKTEGDISAAEEIKELSPALSAAGNDNVFTVPFSYFRDLPDQLAKHVNQAPAKVVVMKTRSSFARYAAAAVITGLLGLTTFSLFNNKSENETVNATALAMVDAKKIIQTNSFDRVMETVSDEEIVGFLQSEGQDVEAALVASSMDSKELPSADDYIINENTLNNYLKSLDISSPN
jgi:hypothetical protein